MNPNSLISLLLAYANQLKFKNLFFLIVSLFIIDLIVPDMIPMIDEIILGFLAIMLANLKKENEGKTGDIIEGEIIDENDK